MSSLAKRLDAHFVACAAAASAGIVGSAEAGIVHSGPVNIVIPDNLDGVYMNVVNGATGPTGGSVAGWDVNPYTAGVGTFNLWGPTTTTWLSLGDITGNYNLPAGTSIDGAGAFFRPGGANNIAPQMVLNTDQNLLGFRFAHEGNANQIHFGWMRLAFGDTAGMRSIVEYAYEDVAGVGIDAGAVPAPASVALLAVGAVGLAGRRRK